MYRSELANISEQSYQLQAYQLQAYPVQTHQQHFNQDHLNQLVASTPGIDKTQEGVRFTLKALFAVLSAVQHEAVFAYNAFQKQLYSGSLHHALNAKGYEVVILENYGKVSSNVYSLKASKPPL